MILFELELGELDDRWREASTFIGEVDGPAPSSLAKDLLVRGMEEVDNPYVSFWLVT
jgi:hypothetical protein